MGMAESALRNVDKRTARREHKEVYAREVSRFRSTFVETSNDELVSATHGDRALRVFVRKRPIFKHETTTQGEFDVVTCGASSVCVHDARLAANWSMSTATEGLPTRLFNTYETGGSHPYSHEGDVNPYNAVLYLSALAAAAEMATAVLPAPRLMAPSAAISPAESPRVSVLS